MSARFVHEGELWIFADGIEESGRLVFDPFRTEIGAWLGGADFVALLSERLELSERMEANDVDPGSAGDLRIGRVGITVVLQDLDDQLTLEDA